MDPAVDRRHDLPLEVPGEEAPDLLDRQVLDAALDRFLTFGIRRTSMDDVATAAGVGRATVYRRFGNRDGLIRAVVLRELYAFLSRVDAPVEAIEDPQERFVEGFVATIREARRHPLLSRLRDIEPESLLPALTVDAAPALAFARRHLARTLVAMQASGAVRAGLDADRVAEMLVRLCHSLVLTPDGLIRADDEDGLRALATAMFVPVLFR